MGRNKCPNCGKRVPEYKLCCPRCGHTILMPLDDPEDTSDSTVDDGDDWSEDGDDGIDDPGLLDAAEAAVRALPLWELAGIAGTYKYTPAPDFARIRNHTAVDQGAEGDEDTDRDEDAADEDFAAEEIPEPATQGGECPACGRQAHKGWKTCPWCGIALPV